METESGLLCFSQFRAQLIRSPFPRFIMEVGRQDWNQKGPLMAADGEAHSSQVWTVCSL